MEKWCACGTEKTGGYPIYCQKCHTFTHPVYVGRKPTS